MNARTKYKVRLTVNGELREFGGDPWRGLLERLGVDADGKDIVTMEKLPAGESGFSPLMEAFIHPDEGARRARHAGTASPPGTKTSTEIFTFCHLCAGHCSMKAIVEDGKLVDLEPDMESGLY